jgi:hypothetical protein
MEWLPDRDQGQTCASNGRSTPVPDGIHISKDRSSNLEDVHKTPSIDGQIPSLANTDPVENDEAEVFFAKYEGLDLLANYWGPTKDITEEA